MCWLELSARAHGRGDCPPKSHQPSTINHQPSTINYQLYTMRSYFKFLRKNKAYTLIDVLGLALSVMFIILIGAYTWQETHLDSQHSKIDRMYVIGLDMEGSTTTGSHWRMIRKLMDQFPEIENGTALATNHRWLKTVDGENVPTNVVFVDSTFYDMFDFQLIRGDRKKVLANPNSIVVTEDYARRIWKDEDPIGKTIIYNSQEDPLIVSGIMAPMENTSIFSPDDKPVDALIPFEMTKYWNYSVYADEMNNATGAEIVLLAKDGTDLSENEQRYNDFAKEFYWILKMPGVECRMKLIPFKDHYFSGYASSTGALGRGDVKLVKILFATGLAILLFALMNYINLTVALSGYRAKEMATRRLLGDSRAGIMMKLMGESTLLCFVSFLIGAALAWLAWPYAENLLDRKIDIHYCVTPVTMAILICIILLMGVLAGIVPSLLISSSKPIDVVRGTFRRQTKMVFSKVFIVVQNMVTITMIAVAVTMYLQINHLINAPLGYNTEGIMYIENGGIKDKTKVFMQRVEQLPGVEMVSASCGHPLQGGNNNTMSWNDRTISFQSFIADENFMKIFGLGLERDNKTTDPVKTYLNRQAINELGLKEDAESYQYYENVEPIAGIIKDFHIRTILDDQHPLRISITDVDNFYPWGFLIKVKGDQMTTYEEVNKIFKEIYEWDNEDTMPYLTQQIEERFRSQSNLAKIVAIFAGIAVIISLLGLVAMSTYFVQQRRREIAVKKVFGCETSEMLRKLVLSFLMYVVIAFVIAIPIIYLIMNDWLSGFSYRISVYWWIYLVSGLACMVISVISVYFQSRKAASENPIKALYQN